MEVQTETEEELLAEAKARIESAQVSGINHRQVPNEKRISFDQQLERVRQAPARTEQELRSIENKSALDKHERGVTKFCASAGRRLVSCCFANFRTSSNYQERVVRSLMQWVATFESRTASGDGIVLYGPVGTGKDHLAFAAASAVLHSHNVSARWMNGRDMFGAIRDRISESESEADFVRMLSTPDMLVISDPLPPIGDLTQYQADMLYRVCEARYAERRLTIATLNVASDEEADRRLGVATWDRLCHGAWKIACCWPSFRTAGVDIKP